MVGSGTSDAEVGTSEASGTDGGGSHTGVMDPATDTEGEDEDTGSTGPDVPGFEPPTEVWRATSTRGGLFAVALQDDDDIVIAGSVATPVDPGTGFVAGISSDGEQQWRRAFGGFTEATIFYEVDCAPDRSVYAVGFQGEGLWGSGVPLIVRLDPDSGEMVWSQTLSGSTEEGHFYGVHADDDGAFVVGNWNAGPTTKRRTYIGRFSADGEELWRVGGGLGSVHAALVHDGTLFVAGEVFHGYALVAVVAAFSPDGDVHWEHKLGYQESYGYFLAPTSGGDGVLAAGLLEQGSDAVNWVLECDADGCDPEPRELGSWDEFDGFAIDHRGHWLLSHDGRLEARIPGGDVAWTYDAEFSRGFHTYGNALAVDSTGAILVGGHSDPPTLLKLEPTGR